MTARQFVEGCYVIFVAFPLVFLGCLVAGIGLPFLAGILAAYDWFTTLPERFK